MIKIITVVMLMIALLSCSGPTPTAPTPQAPAKQQAATMTPAPEQQPKPNEAKPAEAIDDVFAIKAKQFEYAYNPIQKRDPFKPFEGEISWDPGSRDKTPLERYDLSQLQLTAIVWGISEPRALVKAPDGQDYIIKKDMRMGRNSGRIARITKKEVVVAEEYRDALGKLIVKETALYLRDKDDMDKLMQEIQ
jgi:type IV pilus assembly protein PilP